MNAPPPSTPEVVPLAPEVPRSGASRRLAPRRLFAIGMAGLVSVLAYYSATNTADEPLHLYLGLLIMIGAVLPALLWARRGDYRFPVFEVFMLTGANTYALPLLSGHRHLQYFSNDHVTEAALGVLLFQVVANLVYAGTRARPKATRFWTGEVISRNVAGYLQLGLVVSTAYTAATEFTDWIPREIEGVLRAVCFGIGIMATFILGRMWGQGILRRQQRTAFVVLLLMQVVISWTSLYLISGMSTLVLAFLGYVTGSHRLPVLAIALAVPVVAALHTGKTAMREKYWEGNAPAPALTEVPAFFSEWIGHSFDSETPEQAAQASRLLERSSLMHILCMVVAYTPERQPFLDGRTYAQIPGQFVPRFFWPGKPVGHISTHTLSIYYGLQDEEATYRTTIAFGLLSEAYANYGLLGMILVGAVFAFCFKKVSGWAAHSPLLSYPGLFQIVLMAWSFQSELTLAAWLSSLYQACVAVLGVPFLVRNLFGR
jgi:hypothetical protein